VVTVTRRTALALAALAPAAGALLAHETTGGPDGAGRPRLRPGGFRAGYFPNVVLRTHEDREVRFYDDLLKGKNVVISMMYTVCPDGFCPLITANLVALQRALGERVGRDLFMYSITLKPEEDTPAVLLRYALDHRVRPGWWFLTGQREDIELLRRKLGFVDPDPAVDADSSQHTGVIRYGNEALERWGAMPGRTNPKFMAKLIESALFGAGESAAAG
jgi:protein SCO1/2